jgi:curved DNA-binding protein CbpA
MAEGTKSTSKWANDLRVKRQPVIKPTRRCEKPGCENAGDHRAPKSRTSLNEYFWFCLEHVREYNLSWDYFRGMSAGEVDAYQREALTGLRPTWKLGQRSSGPNPKLNFYFRGAYVDPSLVFNDGPNGGTAADEADKRNGNPEKTERKRSKMQLAALETLHLDPDATLQDVKTRFKDLVKRFHPDANGGDRGAEERLRQVIKAYGQLRSSGYT